MAQRTVIAVPTVTKLDETARGAVVIGGSHAAVFTTYLTIAAQAHAAVQHDASIGRGQAGIGGLAWAEQFGFAMAAVSGDTARIGDGDDMRARGIISAVNKSAGRAGVRIGMGCAEATLLLCEAAPPTGRPTPLTETRSEVSIGNSGKVVTVDSVALALPEDRGRIVATGSHGGVPSAGYAARIGMKVVIFNDAGFGPDRAGVASFKVLDSAGIAALAVSTFSARIGDGRSTLHDGIISAANETARGTGAVIGDSARDFVERLAP